MAPQTAPPRAAQAAAAALLLCLLCLLAAPAPTRAAAPNVTLSDLRLPDGFAVQLYYQDAIPGVRSMALSQKSKREGPVIVYAATRGAGQVRA